MKRRDLIKKLEKAGFALESTKGKHDKYTRGDEVEMVPRHKEINELTAQAIIKRRELE